MGRPRKNEVAAANTDGDATATEVRRKKRITKEELEQLLKLRSRIVKSKEKVFASLSEDARKEFVEFHPCERCKFVSKTCHKTCGVIMKWRHKLGLVGETVTYGNKNRIVSEAEYTDTTSVNLGLSDEVDKSINDELNGNILSEANEISFSDLDSYEIED